MVQENHSLEILKQKALTVSSETPGLEAFPDTSIQIPRLLIGQPSNISDIPEGQFMDNLTGATFTELDVVLLKMTRSRALWKPGKPQPQDLPLCRSLDAIHPDLEFQNARCILCVQNDTNTHEQCVDEKDRAVCEHAKFLKNQRPQCRLMYNLLIVLVSTGEPYILSVSGKGISPTNRILSAFKVRGRPPYSARFKISLAKASDGDYYVVTYSDIHWFESPDELKELFLRFKGVNLTPSQPTESPNAEEQIIPEE